MLSIKSRLLAAGGPFFVATCLSAGEPMFEPFELYPLTGGCPSAAAIADFDGDERVDVAVASDCGGGVCSFWVMLQQGDGTFAVSQEFQLLDQGSVAIGDLDGDTRNDLIVPLASSVAVLYQETPGVFSTEVELPATSPALRVLSADYNGDEREDAVSLPWGSGTDAIDLYLQDENGELGRTVLEIAHYGFDDLEGGDLNGDGRQDVAVVSLQGVTTDILGVLFQEESGFGAPAYFDFGVESTGRCLAIADVTGDGRDDVVVVLNSGIGILIQTPTGELQPGPISPAPNSPRACEAADLDRDGHADLVLGGPGSSIAVVRGTDTGTFVDPASYDTPFHNGDRHALRLADIDDNGSIDIVLAADNDGLVILRNLNHRVFEDGFESGDTTAWSTTVP